MYKYEYEKIKCNIKGFGGLNGVIYTTEDF